MDSKLNKEMESFKRYLNQMSEEEIQKMYEAQRKEYDDEYLRFTQGYKNSKCYFCNCTFDTYDRNNPCLHWLLRICAFRKKDFRLIIDQFNFHQLSAYLRWVSNIEHGVKNINDLKEESIEKKIFETTIKWKNIEWTLDCSQSDFDGHGKSKADYPHWHFQMKVDDLQFINFNDYHIPFTKDDIVKLSLHKDEESNFSHSFGYGGSGMQDAMDNLDLDFDSHMQNAMSASNPEDGVFHIQSVITAPDGGISGEKIDEALAMSKKTGKTLAHCFNEVLKDNEKSSITSIISPADTIPDIARRGSRKNKKS